VLHDAADQPQTASTSSSIAFWSRILEAVCQGDPKAADELLPLVYEELRQLAAARMAREAAGNTLQPTALVHEAWLRLAGNQNKEWEGRAHFFAAAAEAMRRILVETPAGSSASSTAAVSGGFT
jgi:RNA polymerase sigma factor (TIGR02999 family)